MKTKFTLVFFWLLLVVCSPLKSQMTPSFNWSDYASTLGNTEVDHIVPIPDGSVLVAGTFMASDITFGNITLNGFTGGEGNSAFIARYDKNGNLQWAKSIFFSASYSYWANVHVSNILLQPNLSPILVISGVGDTLFLPDGKIIEVPSGEDIKAIIKLDLSSGNQTAVNYIRAENGYMEIYSVDVDKDGNLLLAGMVTGDNLYWTRSTVEPVPLQGGNILQAYIVQFDNMLNLPLWSKLFTVADMPSESYMQVARVNPVNQNIIAGGYFSGKIKCDSDSLTSSNMKDVFIAGFDRNGNKLFLISGGGDGDDYIDNIVFDESGNYYVAGASSSYSMSFPGLEVPGLTGAGLFDVFGLKFLKENLSQPMGSVIMNNMLSYYSPGFTVNKVKYIKDTKKILWLTNFNKNPLVAGQLNLPKVTPVGAASYPEYAVLCLDPDSGQFLWGQNFGADIEYDMQFYSALTSIGAYLALPISNYYNLYMTGGQVFSNPSNNSEGFLIAHIGNDGTVKFTKTMLPDNDKYFNVQKVAFLRSGKIFVAGNYSSSEDFALDETILPGNPDGENLFFTTLGFGIQGTVYTPQQQPITKGVVKLYGINTDTRGIELEKVDVSSTGKYAFSTVPSTGFVLFAEPDPELYPNLMGTYYGDVSRWINVPVIDLSVAAIPAYDIYLKERPALTGANAADGSVAFADDYLFDVYKRLKSVEGKPVKSASVVLVGRTKSDGDNIIAQTYTDDNGIFSFTGIPDGSYTVIVDLPGYQHNQFFDFDVTGGQGITGINYLVTEEGIVLLPLSIEKKSSNYGFRIYPNPSSGIVSVSTQRPGSYLLEIYNLSGQKVFARDKMLNQGENRFDLTGIAPGIYHVKISGKDETFNAKLVIQ